MTCELCGTQAAAIKKTTKSFSLAALGGLNALLGRPDDKADPDAQAGEKGDQGVATEQVDTSPHKLADTGLCDAEKFCRLGLFQAPR